MRLPGLLHLRRTPLPAGALPETAAELPGVALPERRDRPEAATPVLSAIDRPVPILLASVAVSLVLLGGHVLPLQAMTAPGGDPGLMVWNLWSVNEAMSHGRTPFFNAAVYYPLGARLAKHTLVPGFWPVTWIVDRLTGHDWLYPVYAYRLCILLSLSCALGLSYLLLRRLGVPRFLALTPALQYAFSPFDRLHLPHLNHISAAFLLPLSGLALLSVVRRPRPASAALLGAALALGVYFSELTAFVYLGLAVGVLLAVAYRSTRAQVLSSLRRLGWRGVAAGALTFVLTLAPFAASWVADGGKAPKSRQASNWSANAAGFVIPDPAQTPLYGGLFARPAAWVSKGVGGHETFLGFPLLLFAGLALIRHREGAAAVLASLAAVFLGLSLGPTLKIGSINTDWAMPYAALMKVPPFEMGRTPVRCVLLVLFCLMPLAALGLTDVAGALRRRFGPAAASGLGVFVLVWAAAEVYVPAAVGRPYLPPRRLGHLEPGPVLNVPLSVFDAYAVFLQTLHGQPIGTGFVSRRTPAQVDHVRALDRLLESDPDAFLTRVRQMGFRTLILGPGTPPSMAARLSAAPLQVVDLRGEAIGWSLPADEAPEPRPR